MLFLESWGVGVGDSDQHQIHIYFFQLKRSLPDFRIKIPTSEIGVDHAVYQVDMSMVVIILIYEVNYRSERDLHSCEVTYKAVTKGFICDCLSYFTTAKISFTSIFYPQFTHIHDLYHIHFHEVNCCNTFQEILTLIYLLILLTFSNSTVYGGLNFSGV